ncbi:MAG TPA: methionyl-tRNA formyltransferase [Spirochaetota bacterium]|nr:methionyl-tRNA formyltransferase [Spirochaetota bacterium]
MKIIFVGTPQIACETLRSVAKHHDVVAVLSQTDKPQGRSKTLIPTDVALLGESLGIKVYKSDKNSDELINELKNYNADIFLVFAYGVILKKSFLEITKFGGINIHPSLLPKYRGPSPIQSAILNGDTISGITIQNIKLKVDSGDILYQKRFEIEETDDIFSIEERVSKISSEIIIDFLNDFENGKIKPISQDEKDVVHCVMFKKEDGLINWQENGESILNKIRAFAKWPVCFSFLKNKKLLIHKAIIETNINFDNYKGRQNGEIVIANNKDGIILKTNNKLIKIVKLQVEGKNILEYKDFLNGYKNLAGLILGNDIPKRF